MINSIYQKYIPLGISVHQSFEKKSFFYRKGDVLGNYIKFLDNTDEYDFFIPLDCDEYIAVRKESGDIGCDGASIELELQKYRDTGIRYLLRDHISISRNATAHTTFIPS